jgi:hypothetical protein
MEVYWNDEPILVPLSNLPIIWENRAIGIHRLKNLGKITDLLARIGTAAIGHPTSALGTRFMTSTHRNNINGRSAYYHQRGREHIGDVTRSFVESHRDKTFCRR